jgi:predicted homoserine dehydrogenase-like protein
MQNNLANFGRDIQIVIIGIGSIGKGLVFQSAITPGINCIGIADIKIDRAIVCAEWLGLDYVIVDNLRALNEAVHSGKVAVAEDGQLLAQCNTADALIESSNAIYEGAVHGLTALDHGTHLIMMNYEADLMYGPLLLARAEENDLVYTSCDGDQPLVIKRLVDELRFYGFEFVMGGNIKGYLDRYVDPTTIAPEADKRNLDYKMCTSYTDGTKLGIEMAVLANGLGCRTIVPGMIGPRARSIYEVFELFDFDSLWQESRQPLVDYILGAVPKGGVFAIGYTNNDFQQFTLDWFPPQMGSGPYYLFYRPYHLGHIEALKSVVEAVVEKKGLLKPEYGYMTNVYSYARRDLASGEILDGLGGYTCSGLIENQQDNLREPGLPICLAEDVTIRRDIKKDEKVLLKDVTFNCESANFQTFNQSLLIGEHRRSASLEIIGKGVSCKNLIQTV